MTETNAIEPGQFSDAEEEKLVIINQSLNTVLILTTTYFCLQRR